MTRFWNQLVASVADVTPLGVPGVATALLILAAITAVLWYTWPPRLPFLGRRGGRGRDHAAGGRRGLRWPTFRWGAWRLRLRRWWWRWRRKSTVDLSELGPDELPDLPAAVLALTADQLAAAGRYAEAVRERLRAIVRELIERDVIEHRPGWTVTELAGEGGRARPTTTAPLRGAADTFSDIWYGLRPATSSDDEAMRRHATAVSTALDAPSATVEAGR